jgi:hypothetical protein
MQVACHIPLEKSWQGIQLCFRPHLNQRCAHKVMGLQSCRNPSFGNFGTFTWEFRDKMTFGCGSYGQAQSILYGGRGWLPPSSGRGESCESVFAHGLSVHQKCSHYALTNLLFGLCRSVWVIDLFVILPSPYLGAPTCPSTPKMLWAKERAPTPFPFIVFTFGFAIESI